MSTVPGITPITFPFPSTVATAGFVVAQSAGPASTSPFAAVIVTASGSVAPTCTVGAVACTTPLTGPIVTVMVTWPAFETSGMETGGFCPGLTSIVLLPSAVMSPSVSYTSTVIIRRMPGGRRIVPCATPFCTERLNASGVGMSDAVTRTTSKLTGVPATMALTRSSAMVCAPGPAGPSSQLLLSTKPASAQAAVHPRRFMPTLLLVRDASLGSADLSLNTAVIESDVAALETALARTELERAVALYVGPFLDGIHLDHAHGSPEFERWVETERSRLAGLIAEALERLAVAATERHEPRRPVEWWRRLAALDPFNARSAAGMNTALAAAGQATGA